MTIPTSPYGNVYKYTVLIFPRKAYDNEIYSLYKRHCPYRTNWKWPIWGCLQSIHGCK